VAPVRGQHGGRNWSEWWTASITRPTWVAVERCGGGGKPGRWPRCAMWKPACPLRGWTGQRQRRRVLELPVAVAPKSGRGRCSSAESASRRMTTAWRRNGRGFLQKETKNTKGGRVHPGGHLWRMPRNDFFTGANGGNCFSLFSPFSSVQVRGGTLEAKEGNKENKG